ncbi:MULTISPECIES: FliM/FliN family flagellar motor switch protein [unclassified Bacillus (in: firmicutes)]|uniref:FliM/FliN family flagellar motor switch protein n=1 Tax=unclassified Bacillus (in: firmicutes) TaxID=185979 RepID=UPI00232F77B3|nr:FliM/FliN family flagellar motor switch protein [Bacillus sp. BP-3]MDC2865771.1 FliM/FliN family flagellar motor switch protein [Bacillus sp. BP-3]
MKYEVSSVALVNLEECTKDENQLPKAHIETVSDISVELGVRLGRTRLTLGDVKNLRVGDILEVEKNLGHKVDVYLSSEKVGIGEAIVMDENFGIIISEIQADKKKVVLAAMKQELNENE